MSVSDLCGVCQQRPADWQCDQCGTLVCEQHYEQGSGICTECAGQGETDGYQA